MNNDLKMSAKNLDFYYGDFQALTDIQLKFRQNEVTALIGPSGCGKSTLMRHMIGLYLPDKGTCTTYGCDAAKLTQKELSRIGYVHQEGELLDWMTVEQLIRYVNAFHENWNTDLEKRCVKNFEINRQSKVGDLSPGQRQKLSILLAIGHEPDFLIIDEPASALDPISTLKIEELIYELKDKYTIVIVTHNMQQAARVSDYTAFMYMGELVEHADTNTLFTNPSQKQTEDYITGRYG